MKKWQVEGSGKKLENLKDLIEILLKNRGISKKDKESFLSPSFSSITLSSLKINKKELKKALVRIKKAIENREKIIVYGDYDVDGVTASAILWETLNRLKADVMPYIPSRFDEGYGLSKEGIDNLLKKQNVSLIITVDNGIVANESIKYAKEKGIDVIVTDHHLPSKNLPKAFAVVHTTLLCGAGVSYILSKELLKEKIGTDDSHLELVALATIADLVPLQKANRVLVKFGIFSLRKTKRAGLLALINQAGIKKEEIGVYEIGHILGPRINAMGRLSSAMDSLRLICTNDPKRAESLSRVLSKTNLERQQITAEVLTHAQNRVKEKELRNLIFIADESYQQGIIGLVAGRLVEEYYLPSIVISKGEVYSKASARSVTGFNIVDFIRTASDLLVDVGGHPMAAGFTVETKKIELLEKKLFKSLETLLKKENLERVLKIDTGIPPSLLSFSVFKEIDKFQPFGMGNHEPTFLVKNAEITAIKLVGIEMQHVRLRLLIENLSFYAIGFGMAKEGLKLEDRIDVVFTLEENTWNGSKSLQLKIRDLRKS
jgi:single-stranded-DNA-specific exonuclease